MQLSPELRPFKFKDTGIDVFIKKVSPNLVRELEKAYPSPKAPIEKVNYGTEDEPDWREEENPLNDEYREVIEKYNAATEERIQTLLIKRGVVMEITPEVKAQVDELRVQQKEDFGYDLPGDDKYIFVKYIAVGTMEDLQDLLTTIMRRSQPVQEAITEEENSFQGSVSGA